jgi:hypothetical protein
MTPLHACASRHRDAVIEFAPFMDEVAKANVEGESA